MHVSKNINFGRAGKFLLLTITFCLTVLGCSKKDGIRVYIANDDHTDYIWTAGQDTYREAFLEMMDYYLDLADSTENELPEHQSRWNCDGSFWLWTYEKNRSRPEFERLIERIRDGHITVPLNPLVQVIGGAPAEAVLRGMYYPGIVERRYGLRFKLAVAIENQTLPYGLGSLWAGAGARYSWHGICNCATRLKDAGDREHEIYWWLGPDSSRILMKWYSMPVSNKHLGGYAEAYNPAAVVDYVTVEAENNGFRRRYPYRVIGAFGKGWDELKTITDEFVEVARKKTDSSRRVIVSNEVDFFEDFEKTYGKDLPVVAASFGNEWDLLCASLAEVSARVKRSVEKLRAAEALVTLVSLQEPSFMEGRQAQRDRAWMNLGLYWEHDWCANGPVPREVRRDWQRTLARQIEVYVDKLHEDAGKQLAQMIRGGDKGEIRFYVFNPLSWTRTDAADLTGVSLPERFHVVDLSTGEQVPAQVLELDGQKALRILAVDVPPVGYKVFELRPGKGKFFGPAASVSGNKIENRYYRVTVSGQGAITGLVDKQAGGREYAACIGDRAINDLGPGSGKLTVQNAGPVSVTLRAEATDPLKHTSRITLIRDSRRIELENEITENFFEIYTWGFSFNLHRPDVHHEEVGAVIRARLVDQGGRYANRNARYDWLTINHFADMSGEDGAGVTLSNADCYFMRLGESTLENLDVSTPQISILAGGQVDGPELGIHHQGGDSFFLQSFALTTRDSYDAAAAMRFALEHQNRLVAAVVTGEDGRYPPDKMSLVSVDNPDVLLWALKPAEEGIGRGVIARLWNLSETRENFRLALSTGPITSARRTTHIETDLEDAGIESGALSGSMAPRQIRTYRIMPSKMQ